MASETRDDPTDEELVAFARATLGHLSDPLLDTLPGAVREARDLWVLLFRVARQSDEAHGRTEAAGA